VLNKNSNNLKCIGKNRRGMNDVPEEYNSHITSVETEFSHTCAKRLNQIRCWGDCSHGNCNVEIIDEQDIGEPKLTF